MATSNRDPEPEDLQLVDYSQIAHLTHLESAVLTEYQNINTNLVKINRILESFIAKDDPRNASVRLTQNLRELETKIPLVYTLFKSAVYALYTRNDENSEIEDEHDERDERDARDEQEEEKGTHELSSISDADAEAEAGAEAGADE
ncbi:uncharacterized protein LODBEIA_P17560 [Lodderomyces beijingensis]|uniref:DASH complex subunit DAD3 n=1 Tax=Lodderomyces beijingensis TaxID=1775926 RepID=A0ABP0ZMW1_9ASCO